MREQSVTRAELARRLGTSQGYVTRLLNGTSNLTLATMSKMAFVLGLELRTSLVPKAAAWSDVAPLDTTGDAAGAV